MQPPQRGPKKCQAGRKARQWVCPFQTDSSLFHRKQGSYLKKKRNEPGMSMITKDRCGKLRNEPGMCMKTNVVIRLIRECYRKERQLIDGASLLLGCPDEVAKALLPVSLRREAQLWTQARVPVPLHLQAYLSSVTMGHNHALGN